MPIAVRGSSSTSSTPGSLNRASRAAQCTCSSVALGGGYRYVISAGDVNYLLQTDLFLPDSKVSAFDVAFGAGYRLMSLLEVRAGFDLRRYQISAGTNTHMVTSGTDQFMAFWAALALTLDGPTGISTASRRARASSAASPWLPAP